ncbi:NADPH2:quinone reductase [Flavobacterium akiainvivens]|nr:NADPH2:quinone reductase [Flavobacterium akiainvivens]
MMENNITNGTIRISRQGIPSVLEYANVDISNPGSNQVVLQQEAIGLNFVDVLFRSGTFPLRDFPATIGVEAAGTVTAIGPGVTNFRVGNRVGYFFSLGAYTEYRLIDEKALIKLPDHVSFDQAASLLAKGMTARMLIKEAYAVKPGDTILIHAAAGGVGSLVSRWAKHLGATVIGTVGHSIKKEYALAHGIDHVIALDVEDFTESVKTITSGKGVQAVYDGVGQSTFGKSLQLIAEGGYAILFGFASGLPKLDSALIRERKINFIQPDLGSYLPNHAAAQRAADDVFEALRLGVFAEIAPTIYSLKDAQKAHEDLESGKTKGPVIFHTN